MPAPFNPRWPRLAVGVILLGYIGAACAAEPAENKIARLGFSFDQRAHDAAVAADTSSGGPETETLEGDVLHLQKLVVTGKRVPLVERELLTSKGRLELAKKRYLTPAYQKTFAPLEAVASFLVNPLGGWRPSDPEAIALYSDAEYKRRRIEMKELINKLPPEKTAR